MTDEREKLIRYVWKDRGYLWDFEGIGPRLKLPVMHPVGPFSTITATLPLEASEIVLNTLEFDLEFTNSTKLIGRTAYRVVCEGVVVEEGYI